MTTMSDTMVLNVRIDASAAAAPKLEVNTSLYTDTEIVAVAAEYKTIVELSSLIVVTQLKMLLTIRPAPLELLLS
ncbi:hypothetical protein [Geomicrobium sp. JCM 19037]|uniref:hypothetical protein n=1 Tax=Geomicrobium sp. JCM 19037 TaxID=1460634 RepID=UPI001EE65558|nr:hypothetical protein [Geomicrobium sp. JCM 19037]